MIGVIADASEQDVVSEFFELFKTPWEVFREDRHYDVVLCAGECQVEVAAALVLVYSGKKIAFDERWQIQTGREYKSSCFLSWDKSRIAIYGQTVGFPKGNGFISREEPKESVLCSVESRQGRIVRIGYDLFAEVRELLTKGQPPANASLPSLDLHIELLRELLKGHGVGFVEIPPIPYGHQFTACLTHDVDHPSVRQHKLDHTIVGFLYRAIFDSLLRLFAGDLSIREVLVNWAAALKLPFVYLGMAKDFWHEFANRYLELEKGLPSTYFLIPFSKRAGIKSDGPAPRLRAAHYGARDLASTIKKLAAANCEIALHGIDLWLDSSKGREELDEIRRLTGTTTVGARMHWLYYNAQSPVALEAAGAAYDSTIGYNETVGYRAGTTQIFKPLNAVGLLELPLHAMDTALFYRSYLSLTSRQATKRLGELSDNAARFGGALTVNWHDRSVVPERLWDDCYRGLIDDLQRRGAWFATAGQAVAWFQKRRSASFENNSEELETIRVNVPTDREDSLPGLRLRIHKPRENGAFARRSPEDYVDAIIEKTSNTLVGHPART